MIRILFVTLAISLVSILNTQAQKNAFSTTWTPTCSEDCIVSILPAMTRDSAFVDSLFSFVLAESLDNGITVAYASWARYQLEKDHNARRIVEHILSASWSQWELMKLPTLLNTITSEELEYLQLILGTNYLLVPYEYFVHDSGEVTTGFSQFRLYDLETGDFIMICRNEFSLKGNGLSGSREVTRLIIEDAAAMVRKALR